MSGIALAAFLLAGADGRDFLRMPEVKLLRAPLEPARQTHAEPRTCYHIKIIRPRVEDMAPMPGAHTKRPAIDTRMVIPAPPACDLLKDSKAPAK